MQWYLQALKKYAVFSGRARRKEYWMFSLVNVAIGFLLGLFSSLAGKGGAAGPIALVFIAYGVIVIIPSLALTVRRLHDTNRNGWWMLISVVPFIGALILLVFMVQEGTATQNQFGPSPKLAAA